MTVYNKIKLTFCGNAHGRWLSQDRCRCPVGAFNNPLPLAGFQQHLMWQIVHTNKV